MTAAKPRTAAEGEPVAFLGVERSARDRRWVERLGEDQAQIAAAIAQSNGVPELLARVVAARGATPDTVEDYLNPTLKALLPDPDLLRDMAPASARIAEAVCTQETIAIFGDYDVDGAASSALLQRFFAAHGLDAIIYIPDRLTEGYGPNVAAFEELVGGEGASLIVTVDCGTTSHEPIARARELGADVIVIDHHLADDDLPPATAIVNPNRQDDLSGLGDLSAAGVAFMTLVAVARELRRLGWYSEQRAQPDLRGWLDLVALATVCDVVPLQGLNRAFVAKGLAVMRYRENLGLNALCDVAALTEAPTPYALGFILGPRINAGGRIGDASLGARLLSSVDPTESAEFATILEGLNKERKAAETDMLDEAMSQGERLIENDPDRPLLAIAADHWHRGLVGLIASRLVERFNKPSLVLTWEGGEIGTGSARSLPGVDIGSAVKRALEQGLLVRGGGHAMAAGLTIKRQELDAFLAAMFDWLAAPAAEAATRNALSVDGALMAASANVELMDLLERAGPFGNGNPEPKFVFPSHRCLDLKRVGANHLRTTIQASSGGRVKAIAFRACDGPLGEFLESRAGEPVHLVGHLRRDDWAGKDRVQIIVDDAADPKQTRL
jgi:single-stranded-DNA-specific exonuclease